MKELQLVCFVGSEAPKQQAFSGSRNTDVLPAPRHERHPAW